MLLMFQRYFSVLSLRSLAASSCGLKKDYACSGLLEKRRDLLALYYLNHLSYVKVGYLLTSIYKWSMENGFLSPAL
jgi:hypothetical protein